MLILWLCARPPTSQTSRVRPNIKENKPEKKNKKHLENITDVSNKLLSNIHIRAVINYNSGGPYKMSHCLLRHLAFPMFQMKYVIVFYS